MNSKERFIKALKHEKTDYIPPAPDTSNMIPCKLTGKPFWEIYLYQNPPLHLAYLEVLKKFRFDGGWEAGPGLGPSKEDKCEHKTKIIERTDDKIVVREDLITPEGTLWQEIIYWKDQPPVQSRKFIKEPEKDFSIYLKYCYNDPSSSDDTEFQNWKKLIGNMGIATLSVSYPGFHNLVYLFDGGLEQLTYTYYDYPELFDMYREIDDEYTIKLTKRIIKSNPDLVLIGASGTLTLSSPELFRKFGLPTLKKITKLCKDAAIPTLLHSCGKSKELVKICAEETDLCGINPLEVPPMGDCDLKELKTKYGNKLCLMGNLHTTNVMLKGTVTDVINACKKAIDDAGKDGGFILSTGDQCPRDTPDENIYALIETAKTYGKY